MIFKANPAGAKISGLNWLAKFLIYGNLIILIAEFFILPIYREMHPEPALYDVVRISLCVIDVLAAFCIVRGWVVLGIAAIGLTSLIMFLMPLTLKIDAYGWPPHISVIFFVAFYFWDFVALVWLAKVRE